MSRQSMYSSMAEGESDTGQEQGGSTTSCDEEGSSELVAPPVSDDEKLDEFRTKLSGVQGIAFGEEKT